MDNTSKEREQTTSEIAEIRAAASILIERMQFLRQAGISFKGLRDLYEVLGYDRTISTTQYRDRYARGGITKRLIEAFPKATWRGGFELIEDEDPKKNTPLEAAWDEIAQRLKVNTVFQKVDILSGLSTYAILLIGAGGELNTELPDGKNKSENLLYLQPYMGGGGPYASRRNATTAIDGDAVIESLDTDIKSSRFGLPATYQIKRTDISTPDLLKPVHWSRVIHIAEGCLDDEVYGVPALEACWNLLDDLDKVVGGGAEAFWLRANQGLQLDVNKDMKMSEDEKKNLRHQAEEYQHQIRRILRTRGIKATPLGSDVANFSHSADAILTQIAGTKGIPKRILTGSEMGELASSQDRDNWKDQVSGRQTGYAGPSMVRPLVDRLIKYHYLPTPATPYEVKWAHIQTLTEAEKTEGAKKWADTNQTNGTPVFTSAEIREKWFGMAPLTPKQIADETPKPPAQPNPQLNPQLKPQPKLPPNVIPGRFPRAAQAFVITQDLRDSIDPAWQVGKEGISRDFKFADRRVCASFVSALFQSANEANHHPDISTGVDSCLVTYVTHSANDTITQLDFEAAARADKLAVSFNALQHKFASTQVNIPSPLDAELLAFGASIPDSELAEDGRELQPHVTVKYGLTTDVSLQDVEELLKTVPPITISFGKTGFFSAGSYNVLFVQIDSQDLQSLNACIAGHLSVVNTHPFYQPHATIAYLKPGFGSKYAGNELLLGKSFVANEVVFSSIDDEYTTIPLRAALSSEEELLEVLEAAIEANDVDVIDKIIGIGRFARSGNFGHQGRPGKVGGSSSSGEFVSSSDALISLQNGEHASVTSDDLRGVLERAKSAMEHGEPALDLTLLTVEGTPIFAGGLNRPRITMPQIPDDQREIFLKALKAQGIKVEHTFASPAKLLPTQNEINAGKVGAMLLNAKKDLGPIMVSKDNYVLDGHHRWAVMATLDVESPSAKIKMPIIRIMEPHAKALSVMEAFTKEKGIKNRALIRFEEDGD